MSRAAVLPILQLRAQLLHKMRRFFHERQLLEVETPALGPSTIPTPQIQSFATRYGATPRDLPQVLYLQTSPEFAMKRLLAQGSGDIYQICKAWRNDEYGKYHNPEFTLLEWYRINYDHHKLMDEMDELLTFILGTTPAKRFSYAAIFEYYLQLNPHHAATADLKQCAVHHGIDADIQESNRDIWLQLLLTHLIEPQLKQTPMPIFVYDFPASQAALAKVRYDANAEASLAARFEVYVKGIELANGFHELCDAREQRRRFERELAERIRCGMECPPLDEKFLTALSDMPDCAGVALGVDRLLMLATDATTLSDVLSFDIQTI